MKGTIDLEIAVLSAMFHLALKQKKIQADTMPGEFDKKNEVNPRPLITKEEFEKLLAESDPEFQDILTCGYESAMRSGEIRKLTAGQVHLNVKHISGETLDYIDLGIFDTKTEARRMVPVSARLKQILERRTKGLKPQDRVFKSMDL